MKGSGVEGDDQWHAGMFYIIMIFKFYLEMNVSNIKFSNKNCNYLKMFIFLETLILWQSTSSILKHSFPALIKIPGRPCGMCPALDRWHILKPIPFRPGKNVLKFSKLVKSNVNIVVILTHQM